MQEPVAREPRSFLVYRDVLLPPSETFIPRMYEGFRCLRPVYLGARYDQARSLLRHEAHRIADHAATGWLGQAAFRHVGHVPAGLRRWIQSVKPALIHAQFGRGGALALPLARSCGLPLVVTFHGGDATKDRHFDDRGPIRTIFQRRRAALARHAALFLCVSDFVRETLIRRGFPPAKLRTHRLGIELPEEPELRPPTGSRRLLFVGRLTEKKGVDDLIAMAEVCQAQGSAVELVVVGDGSERRRLEAKASRASLRVAFTGWLSPEGVADEMARASALVVPSRTARSGDAEGIPTVILEAQARGVPVIATRHGGIPEAIRDGESGLLVPEGRPDALAETACRLLADPALHSQLQRHAFRSVSADFSARRQSERLEDLLLGVVQSGVNGGSCQPIHHRQP